MPGAVVIAVLLLLTILIWLARRLHSRARSYSLLRAHQVPAELPTAKVDSFHTPRHAFDCTCDWLKAPLPCIGLHLASAQWGGVQKSASRWLVGCDGRS